MQYLGFNWLDDVIIAVILLSVIMGLWRGLMREIMSLLVWFLALLIAILFSPMASVYLDDTITEPVAQIGVSFLILFVIFYLLGMLLRHLFLKILSPEPSWGGRILGGIFGLIRGVLFVCVIGFLLAFTTFSKGAVWQNARLIPYVQKADVLLSEMMPNDTEALLKQVFLPVVTQPTQTSTTTPEKGSHKIVSGGDMTKAF